jgi:hypothetical protein
MRCLALLIAFAGCVEHGSTPPGGPPSDAEELFEEKVLPVLEARCGACHATQVPIFLGGLTAETIRQNLLDSGVIDLENPAASRLLTKGQHSGPPLSAAEMAAIREWLEAEQR